MDIYVDILFMENLLANYIILLLTKRILNKSVLSMRLLLAGIVGALYVVLMIIFPNIDILCTAMCKVLLSIIMVWIAFSPINVSEFFKCVCIFFVATFVLAGGMFFFIYLNKSGGIVKNGVVYMFWNSKNSLFIKSVLTVSLILKVILDYIKTKSVKEKLIVPIDIGFDNKGVSVNALLDTGASLSDPLSDRPILVAEFRSVRDLLPPEVQNIFYKSMSDDLEFVTDTMLGSKWFRRFRLIPFNSLGKKNGMLLGFKADNIKITNKENTKEFTNVVVAIYEEILTSSNSYEALIGLELYNMLTQ
ncbi:MAG: sigma-E processing peptidase SpoIIGA [Clostridiales bacterium]|nr:sigma-E processing peptidase SpoIIGA [Clostridiales bacterium]